MPQTQQHGNGGLYEKRKTNKHIKITALYERLSIGDERRGTEESNSIQNQKIQLESYAKENGFTNIHHYTDDDESGRFFDRTGYSRMMEDVESGKIGIVVMKDLTRWGRDHVQVGIAMEIFRQNNVRFIAINHGIDSINPVSLEMAPFINIMSEWFAKDTSKKIRSVFKAKGMAGKHTGSIPPYGYIKHPENKDLWIVDETAAAVVRRIFQLTMDGKGAYQICTILTNEKIPIPAYYQAQQGIATGVSTESVGRNDVVATELYANEQFHEKAVGGNCGTNKPIQPEPPKPVSETGKHESDVHQKPKRRSYDNDR